MSRTALFVIDIQASLASAPTTQIPYASRVVKAGASVLQNARSTIDSARAKSEEPKLEIVIVQHEETPERGVLQRGSPEWELVFPPREGDEFETLVSKDVRDTFISNPGLADELRARNVDTIVAFGIQSECCVLSTCLSALAAGFKVVLLKGAHSTYDAGGKTAVSLENEVETELQSAGAEILDWKDWVPAA